jgi:uncharacterized glyoxalase superfamily protein PhnB
LDLGRRSFRDVTPRLDAMTTATPAGHNTITPYLTVPDADRLVDFLRAAFDGHVVKVDRNDNGRIRHAQVRIGDSILMLNEAGEYPANNSQIHLYVDDVDESFSRALDEGATAVKQPEKRPHGHRMAGMHDPCGNTWWLATPA